MRRVLVTGAGGFVGSALCRRLEADGWAVRRAVRRAEGSASPERTACVPGQASAEPATLGRTQGASGSDVAVVGDLAAAPDWSRALDGVQAVAHLAARVHVMRETASDPLEAFRSVNVRATERLARAAAEAGVRRFVFVSTVKVNGEWTGRRGGDFRPPFSEADAPAPEDAYGLSKLEAERALWRVAEQTGLEVCVVRPPLVHGPGVGGNLQALLRLVGRGLPLPLGGLDNRRSLLGLDNLVDLLALCLERPEAAGQLFLASDGEDLSTPELIRRLARGLGVKARLLPIPPAWLKLVGRLTGRMGAVERLCGSLQVDVSKAGRVLGWSPPVSLDEGLARVAAGYESTMRRERP